VLASIPGASLVLVQFLEIHTFAFETTLSGVAYARRIVQWRGEGYIVKLIFLKPPASRRHWREWQCGFAKADTMYVP
jgi:hypothetical protein